MSHRNHKFLHIGILVILSVGVYFLATYNNPDAPKCPDDYATNEEQIAAFDKWTNDFYDANPEATITDWSTARHQFWVDNNCTAALERYQSAQDGTADPATMKIIDDALQKAVNGSSAEQNVDTGSSTSALLQTDQTTPKQTNTISNTPTSTPAQVVPAQAQSSGGGGSGAYSSGPRPVTPLKCSDYTSYFASIPNCEFLKRNSSTNADGTVIEHPLYTLCKQCLSTPDSTL